MSNLTASIIVPTRMGAQRLPVLLGALAGQNTQDFEVIVVIDGDVDGSQEVVRRWADKLNVREHVFTENRGRAAALNAGAELARGRVLVRCDDDLEPAPDYVSGHVSQHEGSDSGIIGLCANKLPDTPYAQAYGKAADIRFRELAIMAPPELQWRYWGGNVSILREVHERIGGYDGRYRRYGWEDVDYGYRLKKTGINVRIVPEIITTHHAAATTTAGRAVRALHSGAARETFIQIHGENALPEPQAGHGLWDWIVRGASTLATERTLTAYSRVVDNATQRLPQAVAEKLIAVAVESAGLAGIRHPGRARKDF